MSDAKSGRKADGSPSPAKAGKADRGVGSMLAGVFGVMKSPWRDLERDLGYRFRCRALLEVAFVHRSYRFENPGLEEDNQRLEFLGDAALNLASASYLYEAASKCSEGELTAMRSRLTSGKMLARVARSLGLGVYLRIGRGEEVTGGRTRDSTLEDTFEAVMGAVYLDGGLKAVQGVFKRVLRPHIELGKDAWTDNPKGQLQEVCQRVLKVNPRYRLTSRTGPPHESVFQVEVMVVGGKVATGQGRNKQEAERAAAVTMLAVLRDDGLPKECDPSRQTETTPKRKEGSGTVAS
jgi:ribonuclease-3